MMFRLLNAKAVAALNLEVNTKLLLATIKDAIANQTDGQEIGNEDEIYIYQTSKDVFAWNSSGEGYPDNHPFFTVEFQLIAEHAATGTISYTED
jgi:hypothetical protein